MAADHVPVTNVSWTPTVTSYEENVTTPAPHKDFYDAAQMVTGLICYPTFCVLGLVGNVLILIVLSQRQMPTSTDIYLSALAVSDGIKLISDFLYFLTVFLYKTHPPSGDKAFGYLYPYAHFVFNMSVCVSAWLTVSVAVERYILVCHPTRAKDLTSVLRAKLISTACFVLMTALAVPSAFRYRTVHKIEETAHGNVTRPDVILSAFWLENRSFVVSYTWLQSFLRSIIPLFILLAMNAFIINAVRKTRANKKMASRNRITTMLIIVIICFVVCIIPDAVMSAFFNFGYAEAENYLVKGVREITDSLLGVNAAINFLLYMIFNKIFRDQFLLLFCKRCVKPTTASDETKYQKIGKPRDSAHRTAAEACSNGVIVAKAHDKNGIMDEITV